ncbi:MAG: hypothetical protein AAFN65_00340 [Bacteroidota bacterium]
MTDAAIDQGYYLAELRQHYHSFRNPFLEWLSALDLDHQGKIDVFRRSLLAWYEARLRSRNPYTGDVGLYLQVASIHFLEGSIDPSETDRLLAADAPVQDPRDFMPASIQLDDAQAAMYQQMDSWQSPCRDLLMASYYHGIGDGSLANAYDLSERETAKMRRLACLQAVRDSWTSAGLQSAQFQATPQQQLLIDAYMRDELGTESRWELDTLMASEPAVRHAIQMREDWAKAIRVLGRKDTLGILEKEELVFQKGKKKAKAKALNLPKYRLPAVSLNLQNILIGILSVVLAAMVVQTFAGGTKTNKLFTRHYQPLAAPRDLTPSDMNQQELVEILAPYRQEQFRQAYEDLLPAAEAYDEAPLYLGVIAIELEQPQRALQWLRKVRPDNEYYETASWYRVLAYLQAGSLAAAESEAIDIAGQTGHLFASNANRLLEEF